ncbi:MAG: hypothetical protein M3O46_08125 [Myxococcota bacterium]|nr:hypothetical protein [Myxococcota bacterium]
MKLTASGIAFLLALAACAHKKPAEEPENSDDTAASSDTPKATTEGTASAEAEPSQPNLLGTGGGKAMARAEKATIQDDTEDRRAAPCSGVDIPHLFASLSQAACELPEGAPPSLQRATKDLLDVAVSTDSPKVAPGGVAKIFIVFKNKSKAKLPLDFTVDPDPRIVFELYTPKGTRAADKPPGNEPSLPPTVAENAVEPRTARVTLDPNGTAKLALNWQAVKYKWAAKDRAKGALAGRGYPREPAGPLPRGKYVLRVITPLANVDDKEISQPRVNIEVAGAAEVASAAPPAASATASPGKEGAQPAPASSTSDAQVESKFLKVVGATPSPAASARPPAKKH